MMLADDPRLLNLVPVVPQFALNQESELATKGIWTYPAGSFLLTPAGFSIQPIADPTGLKTGCGIVVEWPERATDSPGVSGPPSTYSFHIVALEDRNINQNATVGIGYTSDQLCDIAVDILHLHAIAGIGDRGSTGTLQAVSNYLQPAHDWMDMNPGIYAHRATLRMTVGRKQSQFGTNVLATFDNGQCTLNCSDITATVYFTTDGTPPLGVNPTTEIYSAPFSVTSGQVIYCASRNVGTTLSEILKFTSP
jgi:hypothetical protein